MAKGTFNIDEFRSQIKDGHLRTSNFLMDLNIPIGLLTGLQGDTSQGQFQDTMNRLKFYVEAAPMPGIGLATDEIRRYGHGNETKKPYAPVFDVVDIVVRSDAKGKIYDLFQSWLKLIINFDTRHGVSSPTGFNGARVFEVAYKKDYVVDISLTSFNDEGEEAIKTTMGSAYPIYLGPVQMNWSGGNEVVKFPVKFAFEQWWQEREISSKGKDAK